MPTNSKIKIYQGTVTAGATDGTPVSSGTGASPITTGFIKVPASGHAEDGWIKLAIRCTAGFETIPEDSKHAKISIVDSDGVGKWRLAPDDGAGAADEDAAEDWGDPLKFNAKIGDKNVIFWVRARVAHDEEASNDRSVQIKVAAVIREVAVN